MQQYLDLLDNVLTFGDRVTNRTGIDTISLFGKTMVFDMKDGFPLVTTKKVFYKAIIGELLWMIRGETNIRPLVLEGIDIWNDWPYKNYRQQGGKLLQENFVRRIITDVKFAEKWGDCGPIYGKQWRRWNTGVKSVNITPAKGSYNFTQMYIDYQYIDQLDAAISLLIRDPMSRRIIVNSWNVADLEDMVVSGLPPCHCFFQLKCRPIPFVERYDMTPPIILEKNTYLNNDDRPHLEPEIQERLLTSEGVPEHYLDLMIYIRSNDLFLGAPFNIAQYALLLHILAKLTNKAPGRLIYNIGDAHIYTNHLDQVKMQLQRPPYPLPTVKLNDNSFYRLFGCNTWKIDDVKIENYECHPAIKGDVAV